MKNLTGLPIPPPHGRREYQTLPGEGSGDESYSNPFSEADSPGNDSSSSNRSELVGYNSKTGSRANSARAFTPSLLPGSDYDRYPQNMSRPYSQYSQSTNGRSRSNSINSYDQESNPFIHADFSPFGGYPASDFPLHIDEKEADDYLHNPDPIVDSHHDRRCTKPDRKGAATMIAFVILILGCLTIFIVLPVLAFTGVTVQTQPEHGTATSVNKSALLSPYKYGLLTAVRTSLIDDDTPDSAKTHTSRNGDTWELVFSDEFEVNGRSFYDGDDQFWTGVDIHYAATQDLEWYDPDALTTENGCLKITLDAFQNHNLNYRSGMLQSWNKLCFTEGYIEIGARMPGAGTAPGLWPGLWTIGNLARPGYLATSEGVWPYSYDSCDVGITPNQSSTDGISYLAGQRLPSCACPGSDHPNVGVGRGCPEIDIIEGTVYTGGNMAVGQITQSLQTAPMDVWYMTDFDYLEIYDLSVTAMNGWSGGPLQQAVSAATLLNNQWYEKSDIAAFQSYGFEYQNDDVNGYIQWFVGSDPSFAMLAPALGPNGNVDQRHISREPMSIVMNLGISTAWAYISWLDLDFPMNFEIDYVRIYQPSGKTSLTCDPSGFPTKNYIKDHINAYSDANLTTWAMAGYAVPKNSFMHKC